MADKRVMVINDEEDFLKITRLTLEHTGKYEVLTLANPKDVLDQLVMFKPDVILLDILIPATGGIEICQMLNNHPFGKTVPIIIISALEKTADKLKAYKAGVVGYLVKPIEKENLINAIEKALQFK